MLIVSNFIFLFDKYKQHDIQQTNKQQQKATVPHTQVAFETPPGGTFPLFSPLCWRIWVDGEIQWNILGKKILSYSSVQHKNVLRWCFSGVFQSTSRAPAGQEMNWSIKETHEIFRTDLYNWLIMTWGHGNKCVKINR